MHAIRKRCVLYNSHIEVPLGALVGSRPNRSAKLQRCTTTQQQYTSWSKPSCNTVATQRDHIVTRTGCTATLAATRGAVACQRYTCACLLANNNLNESCADVHTHARLRTSTMLTKRPDRNNSYSVTHDTDRTHNLTSFQDAKAKRPCKAERGQFEHGFCQLQCSTLLRV